MYISLFKHLAEARQNRKLTGPIASLKVRKYLRERVTESDVVPVCNRKGLAISAELDSADGTGHLCLVDFLAGAGVPKPERLIVSS